MREALRLVLSVAVQLFGLYAVVVGGIVYGLHILPDNRDPIGLVLIAVSFIVVETVGLSLLIAGARMRGKRQSGGFPLRPSEAPAHDRRTRLRWYVRSRESL